MTSPFALLYRLAEMLAAISMILILLLVGGGIVLRTAGFQLAGSDDLAAYCLVAIFFLALGPTYRHAEHIRVGLVIDRLPTAARKPLECLLTVLAALCTAWATWWLGRLVYDSHRFGDVAQGLLPVPLWIPQLSMVVGAAILLVALLEDLVRCARGLKPSYLEVSDQTADDQPLFER
ncbi:TRAP transporter small permease [Sinorhizobium alkalisoli]|uniref:TRAP transporter small permease n=1 Tax=Sinorhizobium alkalisoli TaxID=1752398 RepID=UPI00124E0368|nr:TRAP transporter small permease [Sinorhizobium alkalisoli]QFI66697.1 TRAP dicarboxylate transporter, DctQ subunit, unknown substrate 5 [Sinorhizobium alkalisoli]